MKMFGKFFGGRRAEALAIAAFLGLALALAGCSNSSNSAAPIFPQQPVDPQEGGSGSGSGGGGGGSGGGGSGQKEAASIRFSAREVDKITTDAAFTNELTNSGDGAVTYESSDTGVATVDAATGQVTIVALGSATITATVSDSDTYSYEQKTASYALTVHPPEMAVPLTFENKSGSSGTVTVYSPWSTFQYKLSNSDELKSYTAPIEISAGVSVSFYADGSENPSSASYEMAGCLRIVSDVDFYVYGNAMSLIDSQNFFKNIDKDYALSYLFQGNGAHLFNHPTKDLYLSSKTVTFGCYIAMFYGCSNLTRAPALPATELNSSCYQGMFQNCSKLTTAPVLPAKKLASYCYAHMFKDCSKLAAAPALPATTLANSCYAAMFYNCEELTKTPELWASKLEYQSYHTMFSGCTKLKEVFVFATDIAAEGCTASWLYGVAATGMFLRHKKMDSWPKNSASGIPTGWTEYNDY